MLKITPTDGGARLVLRGDDGQPLEVDLEVARHPLGVRFEATWDGGRIATTVDLASAELLWDALELALGRRTR
jgi:hypothetical protein